MATESWKNLDLKVETIFHFRLVDPVVLTTTSTEKKGDAFDRVILRVLHLKTEKVVEHYECVENPYRPVNKVDVSQTPVEIWVYGTTRCLSVEASYIASL
jgi:hypothetical protein